MFPVLLLLFIVMPIIEIAIIIQVGSALGFFPTLAMIILTAVVGASLVRSQGLQTLLTVQQRLEKGELPAEQIIEGLMIAIAGVLLLTPGFVTDTLGMLLLLPICRKFLAKKIQQSNKFKFNSGFSQTGFGQHASFRNDDARNTFEGEFERKNDDQNKLN